MQHHLLRHLGELAEEVRQGRYHPELMRCFKIDKADGKKRLIYAASVRDKLLPCGFLNVLDPLGDRSTPSSPWPTAWPVSGWASLL